MRILIDQIRRFLSLKRQKTQKSRRGILRMKRRREVRARIFMSGILCLMLIALAVTYNTKAAEKKKAAEAIETVAQKKKLEESADEAAKKMAGDTIATKAEKETAKERLKRVKKEAKEKGYPKDIVELLSKNKETVAFVESYEEKKDEPIADTIGEDFKKGEIPSLLQWDQRWGYASYGTGYVATCGCGPTCMSMVISGLKEDPSITPAVVAAYSEKKGYIDENNNTYWELMSAGGENWGISCYERGTDEESVAAELEKGHPIVCSVGPGDFTKKGHFIVLTSYKDGKVKVNDPFSVKNTKKTWKYADIKDQIKALWVYENADEE